MRVEAGENWNDFVHWSLAHGFVGLENLALIPGTVGAAPIQNIGAYGVEVSEFIDVVEAFDSRASAFVRLEQRGVRDSPIAIRCSSASRHAMSSRPSNSFCRARELCARTMPAFARNSRQ